MKQGLIHIYTGTGKGKTTSGVGLAVRALSHGFKVCYAVFNKNPKKYGETEVTTLAKLGAHIMIQTAEHPRFNKEITHKIHQSVTEKGFQELMETLDKNDFDLLIMDEINISIRDHFLDEEKLINFIQNKPEKLEVVMTGRGATDRMKEIAHYVSVITAEKHPFELGIGCREGIEF